MAFRSTLAKVPGRKSSTLKAKSINAIMTPLRQILNEAADRFEFNTPYRNIKPLKVQKGDIEPFTLEEVQKILGAVRADFANYYTVRFFTGMPAAECGEDLQALFEQMTFRLFQPELSAAFPDRHAKDRPVVC